MDALGINLGYVLVQLFSFLILFFFLKRWAWEPLINAIEKRRTVIAQGLDDAQKASDELSKAESKKEDLLLEARKEADEIVKEARDRAVQVDRELRTQADQEIAKQREAALKELAQERERMLNSLRDEVGALAVAAAHKLIGESLVQDSAKQRSLIDEFFSGIKDGQVVVLSDAELESGSEVVVTSALPLSDDDKQVVEAQLGQWVKAKEQIEYQVDPSILGGIIVKVDNQVVDGSMMGHLQNLKQSL